MNKITNELRFNLIPGVKIVDDEAKDYICYSCYKMEIEGDASTDIEHQWGNGVIDPSNSQSGSIACNDCLRLELDEPIFSLHLLSPHLSCTQCGQDLEKNNDLFNVIRGICNHCFLEVANPDHSCIRCDPAFPVPQEAKHE